MDKSIGGFLAISGLVSSALVLRGLSGDRSTPSPAIANQVNVGGSETITCDLADARYGYRNLYPSRIQRRADYLASNLDRSQLVDLREQNYQTLLTIETAYGAYDGNAGVERKALPDGYQWLDTHTLGHEAFPRQSVENDLIFDITAIGYALDNGDTQTPNVSSLKWVGGRCGED